MSQAGPICPSPARAPPRFGGRWNPVGRPTIYAARELSTAWAEYNQGLSHHPATIVELRLRDAALADLTDAAQLAALGVEPGVHACQWRAMLDAGETPPTHRLHARLMADGYDGVIHPSFMSPGGSCVALWRWAPDGPAELTALDPEGRLPRSRASWL